VEEPPAPTKQEQLRLGGAGWWSFGLACLAVPLLMSYESLLGGLLLAFVALVIGVYGVRRESAPLPAMFGVGVALLEIGYVVWWFARVYEELRDWQS
jgi:hypothetical protein